MKGKKGKKEKKKKVVVVVLSFLHYYVYTSYMPCLRGEEGRFLWLVWVSKACASPPSMQL